MALERSGYKITSEEDYYKYIMDMMKIEFPNMSENPSNLLVIMARILARNENLRDYNRAQSYSNAYVATATGQHLDKCVRIAGISRINGTKAIGKVVVVKKKNANNVIIPSGMEIKSGNYVYETTNKSAIVSTANEVEVEIASVDIGYEYNISSNSTFTPVLNIVGIDSIIATTDIEGGTNIESDLSLRERYFIRMSSSSNSSLEGIISAVMSISGVSIANGAENNTDVEINGIKAHSFKIFVNGGTESEIANAIMNSKPAGINTDGDILVPVLVGGRNYDIRFSRFGNRKVYYNIEVSVDRADIDVDFEEKLNNYVSKYTSENTSIIGYELVSYISKNIKGVRGVKSIKFGTTQNPTSSNDLIADTGEIFFTDKDSISITIL